MAKSQIASGGKNAGKTPTSERVKVFRSEHSCGVEEGVGQSSEMGLGGKRPSKQQVLAKRAGQSIA